MQPPADKYILYYHTGCSSCVRTKEFLVKSGIDFVAVDTLQDPQGYEQLLKLGMRYVPAVAKGNQCVRGQNLEDVAEFLGLRGARQPALAPADLMHKWMRILVYAREHVQRVPDAIIDERAHPNRNRTIRMVSHHIFNIAETFLDCVMTDGDKNLTDILERPLAPGTYMTSGEIVRYGNAVMARLDQWWRECDQSCARPINTYYKDRAISMHELLERSTWHSAHHTRQIADVLERRGLEPGARFTTDDLAGLSMPERLWE